MTTRRCWLAAGTLLIVSGVGLWMATRGYGEVSHEGYQYATALFSICNQQDELRLEKLSDMIDRALADGEVQPKESSWLQEIIRLGRAGDWEAASREVRQLMEDQQRRAEAGP